MYTFLRQFHFTNCMFLFFLICSHVCVCVHVDVVDTIADSSQSESGTTSSESTPIPAINTLSVPSNKRRRRRERNQSLMQEKLNSDVSPSRLESQQRQDHVAEDKSSDGDLSHRSINDTTPVLHSYNTVNNLSDSLSNNIHDTVDRSTVLSPHNDSYNREIDNNPDQRTTRKGGVLTLNSNNTINTSVSNTHPISSLSDSNCPLRTPRLEMDNISLASTVSTLSSISSSSAGTQDGTSTKNRMSIGSLSDLEHLG